MRDIPSSSASSIITTRAIERDPLYRGLGLLRLYAILVVGWGVSIVLEIAAGFVMGSLHDLLRSVVDFLFYIGILLSFAAGMFMCVGSKHAACDRLRPAIITLIGLDSLWQLVSLIDIPVHHGGFFYELVSLKDTMLGYGFETVRPALLIVFAIAADRANVRFGGSLIRRRTLRLFIAACIYVWLTAQVAEFMIASYQVSELLKPWVVVVLFSLILWPCLHLWAIVLLGRARKRLLQTICCQNCEYDLTGNESGVCPECGKATEEWQSRCWQPEVVGND